MNVAHTVRGYERAGAAGIQLEDQEFPKKCGHTPGRRVIAQHDMVQKIRVAVEARQDPDMLIVARTDARTSLGLDEAMRRCDAYLGAGADVLFLESPETEQELEAIGKGFDAPMIINVVEGGRTPQLSPAELQRLGFSLAIYPASGFLAVAQALHQVYGDLKAHKGTLDSKDQLYSFEKMCDLMGFPAVWAFDRKYAE